MRQQSQVVEIAVESETRLERWLRRVETTLRAHYFAHRFAAFGEGASLASGVRLFQPHRIAIGRESTIRRHARLEAVCRGEGPPVLQLGERVMVSAFVHLGAALSVRIGNGVSFGDGCLVTDHDHDFLNADDGYRANRVVAEPVVIDDEAFLGERVCVFKGVHIGTRAIVGAGSIVTSDIPAYAMAVGAPARVVKRWDFSARAWVPVPRSAP